MSGQAHVAAFFQGRSGNEGNDSREIPPDFHAPDRGNSGCRMFRHTQFVAAPANAAPSGVGPEQSQPHHHRDDGEPLVR
jgi:hypothetical protein